MTTPLANLVGQRITAAERVHDYMQIRFGNGDLLNVFNEYRIEGRGEESVTDLIDLVVSDASTRKEEVCIALGTKTLRISLVDSAYRGPEAIEYIPASGKRVVWS